MHRHGVPRKRRPLELLGSFKIASLRERDRGDHVQILEGLDMMHQNRFAHRDLKPQASILYQSRPRLMLIVWLQNILIQTHPPSEWWVKVADFGISKQIEEASGGSTLHGTPGNIAPELGKLTARGSPYAPDIWALGETTYQLLTKSRPFQT